MSNDKIIDKISKLLAQAQSAEDIGNADEAAAFSAKAAELMTQYKIDMSDVDYARFQAMDTIDKELIDWREYGLTNMAKRCSWQEILFGGICRLFSCRQLIMAGTNRPIIVGHASNRKTASEVAAFLIRNATYLADVARSDHSAMLESMGYGPHTLKRSLKGFRNSFLMSYAATVYRRCDEEVDKRNTELSNVSERGLSIVAEADQVDSYIDETLDVKEAKVNYSHRRNSMGHNAGVQAGQQAQLNNVTHNLEG